MQHLYRYVTGCMGCMQWLVAGGGSQQHAASEEHRPGTAPSGFRLPALARPVPAGGRPRRPCPATRAHVARTSRRVASAQSSAPLRGASQPRLR